MIYFEFHFVFRHTVNRLLKWILVSCDEISLIHVNQIWHLDHLNVSLFDFLENGLSSNHFLNTRYSHLGFREINISYHSQCLNINNFAEDTFKYEYNRWQHYFDEWSAYMNYFQNLGVIIAGVDFPIGFDAGKFYKIWNESRFTKLLIS